MRSSTVLSTLWQILSHWYVSLIFQHILYIFFQNISKSCGASFLIDTVSLISWLTLLGMLFFNLDSASQPAVPTPVASNDLTYSLKKKNLYSPCTLPCTSLIPQQFLPAWFSVFSVLTAQPSSPSYILFLVLGLHGGFYQCSPGGMLYPSIKLTSTSAS